MLPRKEFLSWSEVVSAEVGVSERDLAKAVAAGQVRRHVWPGRKRGKYRRANLVAVFGLSE